MFAVDKEFAADVEDIYGEYLTTFRSEAGQVEAQLFAHGEDLVAHITLQKGLEAWDVTDKWASLINQYAQENGFGGRLKLVYHER